jgi:hypothetical protein
MRKNTNPTKEKQKTLSTTIKGKKFTLEKVMKAQRRNTGISTLSLTSVVDGDG